MFCFVFDGVGGSMGDAVCLGWNLSYLWVSTMVSFELFGFFFGEMDTDEDSETE